MQYPIGFLFRMDSKEGNSMAGINWTSNSISNFFRTSLNQSNSGMNNLYSLLGDRTLIKSGSYHKLMDAYVKKIDKESKEDTKTKTDKTEKSKKETDTDKKLDKIKTSTYDSTGSKKEKVTTDSIIDKLI